MRKKINETEEGAYLKKYGFNDNIAYAFKTKKGISEEIIKEISNIKNEPEWMLEKRLQAYKIFKNKSMPKWGPDLGGIDFNDIFYYLKAIEKKAASWDDVPEEIRQTFDKLKIPEAERRFFVGTETQYDSEVIYRNVKKELEQQGIIFIDTDTAVKEYPEIIKKYFGTVVPSTDNKFAALNTSVWSGGSFVYVPKGIKIAMPLHAYFRINAEKVGQFERTLIIAEEGSEITYIEGCTAAMYMYSSLHAAVVEIIAHKGSHVRYATIQNWSKNVYNLVTKRAFVYENAFMEWIDGNMGSKVNMKYPSIYLKGKYAKGDILSIAIAGKNQVQDSGGKVLHLASETTSKIISKSVSRDGGNNTYRGLVYVGRDASNVKSTVKCNAIILDKESKTNTYPYIESYREDANITHEATAGKIGEEELFYLMSRGLSEEDAITLIILGFIEPLSKALPLEYSIELKRLIKMDMSKSIA